MADTPNVNVSLSDTPIQKPMGPFTSFAIHPSKVHFETQKKEETVVLFLRQHMIVNVPWASLAIVMAFVPTILPLILKMTVIPVSLPVGYIIAGTAWWYIATFGFALAKFLGWFINIYIVTNERIVDIDFYFLLYKHFSAANLVKIQDISYTTKGIFGSFLNYGNVTIETAGEAPHLVFEQVPNPECVVETIRSLMEKHSHNL